MAKARKDGKSAAPKTVDVCIVGGGLAGGLLAWRLHQRFPELRLLLLEASDKLGGHHTWSFHQSDLTEEAFEWIKPLITRGWEKQTVRFPQFERTLDHAYYAIRSEDFHRILLRELGDIIQLESAVDIIDDYKVRLDSGSEIAARLVIDARGWKQTNSLVMGYQKFIGFDLVLEEPHGLEYPIIMDFQCPQLDGMRFFYLLPWDEKRILVEETYYSDSPELNRERIKRSIESLAGRRGWKVKSMEREEKGILPIPLTSDDLQVTRTAGPIGIGARASLFHSVTGYSVPDAVRTAEVLVGLKDLTTDSAAKAMKSYLRRFNRQQNFYRLLNRMLFRASEPGERYLVMEKFYRLSEDVICRFYSGRSTVLDRLKIFSGKPPVRLSYALGVVRESAVRAPQNSLAEAESESPAT